MHMRPHLDYCDFIFHIPALSNNFNLDINLNYQMRTLESIQYQAASKPVLEPMRLLFGSRSTNVLPLIPCKTDRYSNYFYPDAVKSWNKIGVEPRSIQLIP